MILFGTRWISWGKERTKRANFCIQCGESSRFQLRTRVRFIYFYLIPLIPISGRQKVYRCTLCRATYDRTEP